MASISYPSPAYNSGAVTDLEYERLVSSQAPDGLIGKPTDPAMVYADSTGTRQVKVRANRRALVRGFLYDSGATDIAISLPSNTSGATRIDLIVLRLDRATWTVTEGYVTGTPGQAAPAPTYGTGSTGVWELPLAEVTVRNNATTINSGDVKPVAWYVGDDGRILCTSTTRPPHALDREIYETDTKRRLFSDGSTWLYSGFDEVYTGDTHRAGRLRWSSGRLDVSDGSRWLRGLEDAGPNTITMNAGYKLSNGYYWRRNGLVWVQLTFTRNTAMSAYTEYHVATLPSGFRPPVRFYVPCIAHSSESTGTAIFETNGQIRVNPGANGFTAINQISIAPVTYPAV